MVHDGHTWTSASAEEGTDMQRRKKIALAAVVAGLVVAGGTGAAIAGSDDDASDRPIDGPALQKASDAALAETGGGTVTETEIGDEESLYEVEVTLDNGDQVDVQLDEDFEVVGTKTESGGDDD
jgi:uncharacterized membrane protein YkoI